MKEIDKVKIKGITGVRYLSLFDKFDGRRDAGNNQICTIDEGVTTPRLIQKCRSCDQYTNKIYIDATEELKLLYTEIAVCVEELKCLAKKQGDAGEKAGKGKTVKNEENQRMVAREQAEKDRAVRRGEELMVRLAKLKQDCHNIDEVLRHNLDRAQSTLMEHAQNYWSGVMQGASGKNLPACPSMTDESLSGKEIYLEHRARVMKLLEEISEFNKGGIAV